LVLRATCNRLLTTPERHLLMDGASGKPGMRRLGHIRAYLVGERANEPID